MTVPVAPRAFWDLLLSVLWVQPANRCVVLPNGVCNLKFPNEEVWKTSFHKLICHLCVSFGGVCVLFYPFFSPVFCFLIVEIQNSLHVLDTDHYSGI